MTFSPERIAAYEQLESAINNLREVSAKESDFKEDSIVDCWLLLTSEISAYSPDDPHKPEDDEEMNNSIGMWSKRGALPHNCQALAREYLDRCMIEAIRYER